MTRCLFAFAALVALLACPLVAGAQDEEEAKPKPDSRAAFLSTISGWEVVDGPNEYVPDDLYDLINTRGPSRVAPCLEPSHGRDRNASVQADLAISGQVDALASLGEATSF